MCTASRHSVRATCDPPPKWRTCSSTRFCPTLPPAGARRVAVLLNGLGSTQYEELFVLYKAVNDRLMAEGLEIYNPIVAEAVTSLDMAGCSLSLLWLDDELQPLLDAPCRSAVHIRSEP